MSAETPTLAGAERGRVRPVRVVKGGIWFAREDGELENREAALRIIPQKVMLRCEDLARQFLKEQGTGEYTMLAYAGVSALLYMHHALVQPAPGSGPLVPLFPLPPSIADDKGRINRKIAGALPLWELADGQLQRLRDEYELLLATETPASLTHEQWEKIVSDAGKSSLKTLVAQHGPSAVIQVLHGTAVERWQE